MSQKISKLEEQLNRIKKQLVEEKKRENTRRKILMGIAFSKAADDKVIKPEYVNQVLNKYLTSKSDREFMGLEPLPEKKPAGENQEHQDNNMHQQQPQYQHN